jgi:hypothetical protein
VKGVEKLVVGCSFLADPKPFALETRIILAAGRRIPDHPEIRRTGDLGENEGRHRGKQEGNNALHDASDDRMERPLGAQIRADRIIAILAG